MRVCILSALILLQFVYSIWSFDQLVVKKLLKTFEPFTMSYYGARGYQFGIIFYFLSYLL